MQNLLNAILQIPTAYAQALDAGAVTGETESQLVGLLDFFIVKIPSFIAAFVVFAIFFFLAKAIKGIVESRVSTAFEEHKEVQILAGRVASVSTLVIGATVALNIAGIDLTVIIAAVGFGIGFALKDIIINFLAGMMILAQKQYTIGDFINIDGTIGKIEEIQARATILKALDGTKVVVPNAELFSKQVISYTSNVFRRIEVSVGVEYDTDLKLAVETCYNAIKRTTGVLIEPQPAVLVTEFGDSSINLVVRAWVDSHGSWLQIKSDLTVNIKKEFDKVGIGIPFPIRTIVYDKDAKAEKEVQMKELGKIIQEERAKEEEAKAKQPIKEETEQQEVKPAAVAPILPQQPQLATEPVAVEAPAIETPVVKPAVETKPSKDQSGSKFLERNGG